MIIDSHTHIEGLPGCPWQDPPEMILGLCDEAGVDQALVMTYVDAPGDFEGYDPLAYVEASVAAHPGRLLGYARLNPLAGDVSRELLRDAVLRRGFIGLKLHPYGYRSLPEGAATVRLMQDAAELRVPVLYHCGDEECTLPLQVARAAAQVPEATVIMGHMGGYFHVDAAIRLARRHPNLYLETSAMPYPEKIAEAVAAVGPERVLYASDGPGCNPRLEVHKVHVARLGRRVERMVFAENIQRLLAGRKGG